MSGLEDIARTIHAASCDCDNPERYEYSVANADQAKAVRDYLLSDEAVERAAKAMAPQLWRLRDEGYESETHGQQIESSLLIARAALTAAIEGEQ